MKERGITEYSVLVCILLLKIWCGFANQAMLFTIGGPFSGVIDIAICAYAIVNINRINRGRNINQVTYKFIVYVACFFVVYSFVFSFGAQTLPKESFLGLIVLPKQISNAFFNVIYLIGMIPIVKNLKIGERKFVSDFMTVVFFAVAIANIVTGILNPELVKNEAYTEGTSLFTLGYSGSYNLMLIAPILLYKIRSSKSKVLFVALFICNFVSIFYGGYFIAILGTIIAFLMYVILRMKNKGIVIFLSTVMIVSVIVLISSGTLEKLMLYLADNIDVEVISGRCRDIARYLSGDTSVDKGDTTFRIYIYKDTWNSFLKHPLLGNYIFGNYNCQWDHATLLDILSVGGLILGSVFFALIALGYKFASSFMKDERAKRALLASIIAYLFVACINSVLSYKLLGALFILAPIMMGGKDTDESSDIASL